MKTNALSWIAAVYVMLLLFLQPAHTQEYYPFDIYNTSVRSLTMNQANQIADNLTVFTNNRILDYGENWVTVGLLWAKTLTLDFYLTSIWAHEEGHRSVLTAHGINSKNRWKEWAVTGVSTATLQNFKRDHYTDFIRLHTAGLESQAMRIVNLERMITFDRNDRRAVAFPLIYNRVYMFLYLNSSITNNYFDVAQDEFNTAENERDIVGHDVYGMTHHLFNKDDIDYTKRYNHREDLTDREEDYVSRIESMSWLTFLNTSMFLSPIQVGNIQFTSGMNYYLAPFGDVTELNTFISSPLGKNRITMRLFGNHERFFPAIELSDHRRDVGPVFVSTTAGVWQNPRDFDFFTDKSEYGASLDMTIEYMWRYGGVYAGLFTKTAGFVPGYTQKDLRAETTILLGGSVIWNPSWNRH